MRQHKPLFSITRHLGLTFEEEEEEEEEDREEKKEEDREFEEDEEVVVQFSRADIELGVIFFNKA